MKSNEEIIADRLKRIINIHQNKAELIKLNIFWDDLEQLLITVLNK